MFLINDRTYGLDNFPKVDVGKLMRKIIKLNPIRKKCGHLPKIVSVSKGSIFTWLTSSLCARCNYVANQIDTK